MNDYKELGLLYEAFSRNPNVGHARDTSRSYPPGQSDNIHHSFGPHIPFNGTKGGGAFDQGQGGQGVTAVISDEENADMSTFLRNDILKKVESLIKDAERFEDTKTLIALSELKRYIEKL